MTNGEALTGLFKDDEDIAHGTNGEFHHIWSKDRKLTMTIHRDWWNAEYKGDTNANSDNNGTPQLKMGHWIRVTDKTGHLVWECNRCGWQQRFTTDYCPDCGANMVEPQESEE